MVKFFSWQVVIIGNVLKQVKCIPTWWSTCTSPAVQLEVVSTETLTSVGIFQVDVCTRWSTCTSPAVQLEGVSTEILTFVGIFQVDACAWWSTCTSPAIQLEEVSTVTFTSVGTFQVDACMIASAIVTLTFIDIYYQKIIYTKSELC